MRPGLLLAFAALSLTSCAAAPPPPRPVPTTPPPFAVASELPTLEPPLPAPPLAAKQPKPWTMAGRTFQDDYAWLRKKDDPKVIEYLKAENTYAELALLPTQAIRDKLFAEMKGRVPEDDSSAPWRHADSFFYTRVVKDKEHEVFCRKRGNLDAPEEVILDLNAIAEKQKFVDAGESDLSPDNRYYAYGLDVTGFRQFELHVRDLSTGKDLPDRAERVTSMAFAKGAPVLFYTVEDPVAKRSYRLYRHRLGDPATKDTLLYEEKDERFEVEVERTSSDAFIVVTVESHTTSEVRVVPADRPEAPLRVVFPRKADQEYDIDHQGDRFLVHINDTGRNFRLASLPVASLGAVTDPSKLTELVPHRPDVMLTGARAFRDHVVLAERQGGLPRLTVVDTTSRAAKGFGPSHVVTMPDAAYEVKVSGTTEYGAPLIRYVYQSPITPPMTIDYDPRTRERRIVKAAEVRGGFDREAYDVARFQTTARDGVKVPVTLIMKKGTQADGTNPVLLYGYGAYGHSTPVSFASPRLSLVDRGVIWAIAHVRGGGELGKPWHDAGRMANKKKSFEDFIDVGEDLLARRWAKSGRIASWGASAGGLLVTAAANMRPDLFRAVVASVPFVDVLNTMSDETLPLTVGEFEEWGNPKVLAEFERMAEYSPYDNIAPKAYPAMLVRTSLNDSQVMYWEPAKYVARLRVTKRDSEVLVFRTLLEPAGHGGRSGRFEWLADLADDYAFVLWQLGLWPA